MEEADINMSENGRQLANETAYVNRGFPLQIFSSTTGDSPGTSSSFRSTPSYHLVTIKPDTTNEIVASNSGTSQGEDRSPSPTNGIASNSGPSQGEEPSPSPANGIASSSGPSQGVEPGPKAAFDQYEINGKKLPGNRALDDYRSRCSTLLQAAIKGDWPSAKAFLKQNKECVRARITKEGATALHIAAAAQHTTFIKKLLKLMTPEDLLLKTNHGFTVFHSAAQSGIVGIAKQLLRKSNTNNEPLFLTDNDGDTPLIIAAYLGHANMVSYLFSVIGLEQLTNAKRINLLGLTVYNDLYDIALEILKTDSNIATVDNECWWEALEMLARKPFAIGSESQLSFWKRLLNSWFKGIYSKALMKSIAHQLVEELWKRVGISDKQLSSNLVHNNMALIFEAAKVGNVEFLIILTRSYPDLIWQQDKNKMSIFHIAILYRHESVFNLIYEIGADKDSLASYSISKTKENMLHLAGKLAPLNRLKIVSGAALQMQRELLWFKEIEKIVPRSYVSKKNSKGKTPKEIFIKAHKDLQKDGEKWMKNTANYCMLVATLIATVNFAAAFTVPGGSNQATGAPIFLKRRLFMVFFISDAVALCSSSTSIVIFLSILTSRYTEEDFLKLLPSKLMFGLATLFISMAGMMVAFSATCFLVYTSVRAWALVVVITLASIPITLFVVLHRKLWVDTFLSTYKSKFLFGAPHKHRLFYRRMLIRELISRKFEMQGKQKGRKVVGGSQDIEQGQGMN